MAVEQTFLKREACVCPADHRGPHPAVGWAGHRAHLLGAAGWQLLLVPLRCAGLQPCLPGLPQLLGLHHRHQHHGAHFPLCEVGTV